MSVALIADAVDALNKLTDRTGFKKVDIINRALSVYEFFEAELRAGNDIVVRDPEGGEQRVKIF
jgi:hypothetical protein